MGRTFWGIDALEDVILDGESLMAQRSKLVDRKS